jgi:uncharacterized protein YkwD
MLLQISCAPHAEEPAVADELARIESEVVQLVNDYRARQGLGRLRSDPAIAAIARRNSQAIAARRQPFSHVRFSERTAAVSRVMDWDRVAENIAFNNARSSMTALEAFHDWLTSSGHRRTIEGAFDHTGVGVALDSAGRYYFTQLFVERK